MSAGVKLELLGLIDSAVAVGFSHAKACRVLGLEDVRAHRWAARLKAAGALEDRPAQGDPVHRILAWEERAILELIETWGFIDRSHRKLAHRGSYTGVVFVSPSTLLRVALKHRVSLPGEPFRARPLAPVLPEVPWERNRIWIWDAERHDALWSRAVVRDHRGGPVAAGSCKLGAAYPVETDGYGWQAAPTTTERASTARWSGSGKRDGKVYERNQRLNAPQEHPPARTWQIWAGQQRVSVPLVRRTPGSVSVVGWEATVKICGVVVARLQGHSWSPNPSNGSRVNVGTIPVVPSPASMTLVGGKARRRLMPPGWGGGLVVVAGATAGHGGRESRPQGEGVQQVRSSQTRRGGRR
ncbi:MAG: hypothetical protein ACRDKL_07495 [Solirubrobacteraceae bacterium]